MRRGGKYDRRHAASMHKIETTFLLLALQRSALIDPSRPFSHLLEGLEAKVVVLEITVVDDGSVEAVLWGDGGRAKGRAKRGLD